MATSVSQIESLVDDLEGNIDDLEAALRPLLEQALSSTTANLPLLDKAKVYVLATYAIESLLFSYLRLNGVDAKEHAVFRELTRVKAYFEKLKVAELGPEKRTSSLDKNTAARFIKHGLSGNAKLDEQSQRRKEMQQAGHWGAANRFEGTAKRIHEQEEAATVPVVSAATVDSSKSEDIGKAERKAAKRQRRAETAITNQNPSSDHLADQVTERKHKKSHKSKHASVS